MTSHWGAKNNISYYQKKKKKEKKKERKIKLIPFYHSITIKCISCWKKGFPKAHNPGQRLGFIVHIKQQIQTDLYLKLTSLSITSLS